MLRKLTAGLRGLFRRDLVDRELDEEMADFLERAVAEREREGLSPPDASRAARAELGSLAAAKDEVRAGLWESAVIAFWRDVKFGARMLRRQPGFTAVSVLTLGLGIGATTALFSLANEILLKPLPVTDPNALVLFKWAASPNAMPPVSIAGINQDPATGRSSSSAFPLLALQRFQTETKTLAGVFGFASATTTQSAPGANDSDRGHMVSAGYFSVLGTTPALGRLLTPDDDRPDAPLVAVISHRYWQRRFGGDPYAIGQTLRFDPARATIVGVTPAGFTGTGEVGDSPDFFLPLGPGARVGGNKFTARMQQAWVWPLRLFGRLAPGQDQAGVQQELQGVFQSAALEAWRSQKGKTDPSDLPRLEVSSGSQGLNGQRSRVTNTMAILAGIVGTVLLIICVNIASLLLARAETRRPEMAVRRSLGASRGRLVRQLLIESALLTTSGAALGVLLAYWGRDVFYALVTRADPAFVIESRLDFRVLALTIVVSWLIGVLIGLAPGLRATRVDPHASLKETRAPRRRRAGIGPALLVTQVALSLLLVVTAGLFVRTLRNLQTADVGFEADHLLLFRGNPPAIARTDAATAQVLALYAEFGDRMRAIPGVQSATLSQLTLLGGDLAMPYLIVPGQPRGAGEDRTVYTQEVSPTFFDTMRMPLTLGRPLAREDVTRRVALVNETLAHRFFPNGTAVGQRIGISKSSVEHDVAEPDLLEIVGVVRDAKYMTLREPTPPTVFMPMKSASPGTFAVRVAGDPMSVAAPIRELAKTLTPNLYLYDFRTQRQQIEQTLVREHEFAFLSTLFGLLALALTSIGLYGLLSYSVARRTQEIGIRMALGADRWHVVRRVLRQTMALVAMGVVMGLAGALALARLVQSLLFGVTPNDPATIVAAVVLMLGVALLAGALPARRAARVDPLIALRTE